MGQGQEIRAGPVGGGRSRCSCAAALVKWVSRRSTPWPPPTVPGSGTGSPAEPPSARGGPHSLGPSVGRSVPRPIKGRDGGALSLRDGGVGKGGPGRAALACRDLTRSTLLLKGAGTLGRQRGGPVGQGGQLGKGAGRAQQKGQRAWALVLEPHVVLADALVGSCQMDGSLGRPIY